VYKVLPEYICRQAEVNTHTFSSALLIGRCYSRELAVPCLTRLVITADLKVNNKQNSYTVHFQSFKYAIMSITTMKVSSSKETHSKWYI